MKKNSLLVITCLVAFAVGTLFYIQSPDRKPPVNDISSPQIRLAFPAAVAAFGVYDPSVKFEILDQEDLVVGSGVTNFQSGVSNQAQRQVIFFQGDQVRFKFGSPTRDNGAVANEGDMLILDQESMIQSFEAVVDAAGSGATLYTVYLKRK